MMAALFLPGIVLLLWVAPAHGWIAGASYEELSSLVAHPLTRLFLFFLIALSLFHWAHRFRFTLYDGLQLYHLNQLIAVLTYGTATALTAISAYVLWTFA